MSIETLRTPDSAFNALPGYPYKPNHIDDLPGFDGMRVHYVDTGADTSGRTYVCLHGQPTWSYLYRRMIPIFAGAGHRVVAPDLLGFGRSDKPVDDAVYTFGFHREMLLAFLGRIDGPITLVVQDWGGVLGLTLPMEMPQIDQLLVMNTGIAIGKSPSEAFDQWQAFVAANPDFSISGLMSRSCPHLTREEALAYDAPFPDARYRAGARRFPAIMPTSPEMDGTQISIRARDFFRDGWTGDAFVAIGELDPVLGPPVMEKLAALLKCNAPMRIAEANHFVQEWGEPIAEAALRHFDG